MMLTLVGTVVLAGLSMLTLKIASGHWWCRYGREALILWACVGMTIAILRALDSANVVTPYTTRIVASIIYIIAAVIMGQIFYAHQLWHKVRQ